MHRIAAITATLACKQDNFFYLLADYAGRSYTFLFLFFISFPFSFLFYFLFIFRWFQYYCFLPYGMFYVIHLFFYNY